MNPTVKLPVGIEDFKELLAEDFYNIVERSQPVHAPPQVRGGRESENEGEMAGERPAGEEALERGCFCLCRRS